jgi:hypothetical protein
MCFKVGDIIKVFLYSQHGDRDPFATYFGIIVEDNPDRHDNITGRYLHDQSSFHFPNNGELYDKYGRLVFQKVSE